MEIKFTSHAYRQYKKLPPSLQLVLKNTISELQKTPFPTGYKKLAGREGYRLRYGNYRIIYKIDPKLKQIIIQALAHRREVYKM